MSGYDSTADTLKHIKRVSQLLTETATELIRRANVHDNSKLLSPEKEGFDEYTPKLAKVTYGSEEYKGFLDKLKPSLDHHYAHNSHHPEYYKGGVDDMNLFDVIEMFMDWKAAGERHEDGNIFKSIDHNKVRFKMSDQLTSIFRNTAVKLGWGVRPGDLKVPAKEPLYVEENVKIKTELTWATTDKGDTVYAVVLDTGQFVYVNQANTMVHPVDIIKKASI